MYVRLSHGARRPSRYSFPRSFPEQIHFLSVLHDAIRHTGNNMSLFLPSVTPSPSSRVFVPVCWIFFALRQLLMTTTPSVSCCGFYIFLLLAPDSPLLPSFIWSPRRSFELFENATLQKPRATGKDILHTCVFEATLTWRRWNLQRKSPAPWALPLSHPLSRPLLMNYLSPQSIDAFSCILHPSWDRWFSFICAVIIVGGRGRADTTWKPKFNCCHRRAHLRERRVAVLAAGHAASKKFPPRTLMLGLAADKPQSLRGTEIERSTRGGLALFVRTCVCALLKSIRAAHNKHPWNRDGGVRRVISEVIEGR